MSIERLDDLLEKYWKNIANSEEVAEMLGLLEKEKGEEVFEKFTQEKGASYSVEHSYVPKLEKDFPSAKGKVVTGVSFGKYKWIYAAAAVLFVIASSIYWLRFSKPSNRDTIVKDKSDPNRHLVTGKGLVYLTLADNKVIQVNEVAKGTVGVEGGVDIIKLDSGWLMYKVNYSDKTHKSVSNTLTTARGVQGKVILPDGSKVWLNAESALTYEIAFDGQYRNVHLNGEAYFEVTENSKQPFWVTTNGCKVGVLGTRFNVHAYANEKQIKTTLLAGSVVIENGGATKQLIPGQQAIVLDSVPGTIKMVNEVDLAAIVAWKENRFLFNGDIRDIMQEISRWYSVEVIFEEEVVVPFVANVSRDTPLAKLLELLEQTGSIHFTIQEDKVLVRK